MKKDKKKRSKIGMSILVILLLLVPLVSCGKSSFGRRLENSETPLEDGEFVSTRDYIAPEIKLDGVLDEEQWENASVISYGSEQTVQTEVLVFKGESGIYIGAEISDDELTAKNSRMTYNSCFTILFYASGTEKYEVDNQVVSINIDVEGNILMKRGRSNGKWTDANPNEVAVYPGDDIPTYMEYAVDADGTLNDDKTDHGYNIEVFINYTMVELIGGTTEQDYGMYFETVYYANGEKQIEKSKVYGLYNDTDVLEERRKTNYAKYKIDGIDDDIIWQGRTSYEYETNSDYAVSNYIAEEGVYFFFDVKDNKVCADGNIVSQNDSIEIYLDVQQNKGKAPQEDDIQIRVDVAGNVQVIYGNGERWSGESLVNNIITATHVVNGKMNGSADGYCLEMFIPWSDLKATQASSSMNVYFGARDWDGVTKSDGTRTRNWYGTGENSAVPNEWLLMTKTYVEGRIPASEIVLDGVFKDALWEDAEVNLVFGGTVKLLTAWTDRGCYFAIDVTDSNIHTTEERATKNSSVEVYLDYKGDGGKLSADNRAITVDAAGNIVVKSGSNGKSYEDVKAVVKRGTTLTKTGYSVEIYVPWEEFDGGKPTQMKLALGNRVFLPTKTTSTWLNDGYCTDVTMPKLYATFTENGIAW